jgi:hypothetical protein
LVLRRARQKHVNYMVNDIPALCRVPTLSVLFFN